MLYIGLKLILPIAIMIISSNSLLSLTQNQLTDNDSLDFIKYASGTVFNDLKNNQSDTISSSEPEVIISTSDSLHVSASEFLLAGTPRYTIDGSLPMLKTKIKPIPGIIIGSVFTSIFIVQHVMQQNTIWKDKSDIFATMEDYHWTVGLDKAGHFYGTYMPAYVFSEALMMTGLSWDASVITGSVLGLAYTGYVEVLDGYSRGFGFSPSDFYADIAGAAFFLAQHYVPFLQNFTPKFQYVKPSWIGEYDRIPHDSFIDNYSAQVFWMSVNVNNMLPGSMKDYWPDWLELSFGYGVYSLCDYLHYPEACEECGSEYISKDVRGNQKFLISLDYNLRYLLPDGPGFWNWLKQGLNYFKLPSPTLEIGKNNTKFYLMYPFTINF